MHGESIRWVLFYTHNNLTAWNPRARVFFENIQINLLVSSTAVLIPSPANVFLSRCGPFYECIRLGLKSVSRELKTSSIKESQKNRAKNGFGCPLRCCSLPAVRRKAMAYQLPEKCIYNTTLLRRPVYFVRSCGKREEHRR